jgi:hypothetical protein
MPQSAMSAIVPSAIAPFIPAVVPNEADDPETRALLWEAVLAGPASRAEIGPALGCGFLRRLAGGDAVGAAVARAGMSTGGGS